MRMTGSWEDLVRKHRRLSIFNFHIRREKLKGPEGCRRIPHFLITTSLRQQNRPTSDTGPNDAAEGLDGRISESDILFITRGMMNTTSLHVHLIIRFLE